MSDSKANCKRDAKVAEVEASSASFFSHKKTRVHAIVDFELKNPTLPSSSPAKAISPAISSASGGSTLSVEDNQCSSFCSNCSSNESYEIVKDSLRFVDLKAPSFGTEIWTCISNKFRETSPSSEICRETVEMDSAAKNPPVAGGRNHRRKRSAARTPPQAEIDEFFTATEKYEQKRFAEKYNYDIVKDAPQEGRYQWVRLKP